MGMVSKHIQAESMLSCCLHLILTLPYECHSRNGDQAMVFVILCCLCGNFSLSFPFLANGNVTQCNLHSGMHPSFSSAFRDAFLHTLVIRNGFWVAFLLVQSTLAILHWLLASTRQTERTTPHWIFYFLHTFCVNPGDGCVGNSQ